MRNGSLCGDMQVTDDGLCIDEKNVGCLGFSDSARSSGAVPLLAPSFAMRGHQASGLFLPVCVRLGGGPVKTWLFTAFAQRPCSPQGLSSWLEDAPSQAVFEL